VSKETYTSVKRDLLLNGIRIQPSADASCLPAGRHKVWFRGRLDGAIEIFFYLIDCTKDLALSGFVQVQRLTPCVSRNFFLSSEYATQFSLVFSDTDTKASSSGVSVTRTHRTHSLSLARALFLLSLSLSLSLSLMLARSGF